MRKSYSSIAALFIVVAFVSCSRKTYPDNTTVKKAVVTDTFQVVKKTDSLLVSKPVVKRKPKEAAPKVIVVNDKFASRSVDGRYYYDLQGKRYWRNNKDGKYYLFNKSMLTDAAFKKPN